MRGLHLMVAAAGVGPAEFPSPAEPQAQDLHAAGEAGTRWTAAAAAAAEAEIVVHELWGSAAEGEHLTAVTSVVRRWAVVALGPGVWRL